MDVSMAQLLALIGAKEVELMLLRERLAQIEAEKKTEQPNRNSNGN